MLEQEHLLMAELNAERLADEEMRKEAQKQQEAEEDEQRRERARFVRIIAGRGGSIPDIVQSTVAKVEANESLSTEEKQALAEFAEKWAKAEEDAERQALEDETEQPTKESYTGKNETADLAGMGFANTFDLTAAPGEVFHGDTSKKNMTPTKGMFEGKPEAKAESPAAVFVKAPDGSGYVESKRLLWQSAQSSSTRQAEPSLKRREESSEKIKPKVPEKVKIQDKSSHRE